MSEARLETGATDYADQVREYLAYCADARRQLEARGSGLDPHHHPTSAGCLKMIPHGSDRAAADVIRRVFGELTAEVTRIGADIPEPEAGL